MFWRRLSSAPVRTSPLFLEAASAFNFFESHRPNRRCKQFFKGRTFGGLIIKTCLDDCLKHFLVPGWKIDIFVIFTGNSEHFSLIVSIVTAPYSKIDDFMNTFSCTFEDIGTCGNILKLSFSCIFEDIGTCGIISKKKLC